ncbi:pheromone-regulated membrane protein [Xylariaceae sp. FL0255]|nr:pheromone-regulated membrane protein [Xylariaceae sp. FL0255]
MAEGAIPGAPDLSGTDNPAQFFHQPPPVSGLDDLTSSAASTSANLPNVDGNRKAAGTHARFPEEPEALNKIYSARPRPVTSGSSSGYAGEKDREPSAHNGFWASFRKWIDDWREDFGAPRPHQDIRDLIGDTGIDITAIRKIKSHGSQSHLSSLIGPSLMMARPGLGDHKNSSASTPNIGHWSDSGTSTPSTPIQRLRGAVDPGEVARALKKVKDKIVHTNDPKQVKYIQSKSELAHRRNLVLLMVYAFMAYGAPSHRIEEYTLALFKALELEGRVNYTVGCSEIAFINPVDPADPMTRSAYTTLVKAQGLDIGACEAAFRIYKDVVHGQVTIEEATQTLIALIESPSYYKPWWIVPFYGLASAIASVWAYGGWWSDMAIAFPLGCIVGLLQIIVAARNPLYANVLEVSAAVITSFGARAFSSIGGPSQKYFCFGAIAESSITTILPGYLVLCGALELQSKSVTAGSTRLFYAVMYSLFLGYGIDVGAQLWAVIDTNAVTDAYCPRFVDPKWKILLVPTYIVLQAILIRSRPRQIPVQVLFGSAAYTVNFFVSKYTTAQVADTASAFTLGVLGHLWARSHHAFAFASVVTGIMILVPSGISAQGGLVSGIATPLFNNGTTDAQQVYEQNIYQSFSVGAQMIQVGVGLATGLFVSALVVYPFGRKNNALFSF